MDHATTTTDRTVQAGQTRLQRQAALGPQRPSRARPSPVETRAAVRSAARLLVTDLLDRVTAQVDTALACHDTPDVRLARRRADRLGRLVEGHAALLTAHAQLEAEALCAPDARSRRALRTVQARIGATSHQVLARVPEVSAFVHVLRGYEDGYRYPVFVPTFIRGNADGMHTVMSGLRRLLAHLAALKAVPVSRTVDLTAHPLLLDAVLQRTGDLEPHARQAFAALGPRRRPQLAHLDLVFGLSAATARWSSRVVACLRRGVRSLPPRHPCLEVPHRTRLCREGTAADRLRAAEGITRSALATMDDLLRRSGDQSHAGIRVAR